LQKAKKHKGVEIDLIIASPLSRAHNTAELFAEGAQIPAALIELNDLLIERNFGILEGTPWSATASHLLGSDNLPEGVETWDSMVKRAQQLLDYIERLPVDNILLVGHGSIGRTMRSIVVPEADVHAHLPNSELVRWI
jgi:broad specificity phosphatase PhoE